MPSPNEQMPTAYAQERKYRRFNLRCPVQVKFGSGESIAETNAVSRNVSLGGMLFETASRIPEGTPVSFVMRPQGGWIVRPIELAGEGRVVRVETTGVPEGYVIAVQCKHPIIQIEPYLA